MQALNARPGPTGPAKGRVNAQFLRADVFTFLSNLTRVYGDNVRFDIGHAACVFVNGAEAVDHLLRNCERFLEKPEYVTASNRGHWGDGLTTLEGQDWHARRRLLRPQFRPGAFAPRLSTVADCTQEMLRRWQAKADVDLNHEIRVLTARIAARTVLGFDLEGCQTGDGTLGVLPLSEIYGEDFIAADAGDTTGVLRMVRPRAPRHLPAITDAIRRRTTEACDGPDVLSTLIRTQRAAGMTPDVDMLIGEMVQMLYAGHLTIPASLGALWNCVSENRHAADRIAEEADLTGQGLAVPTPAILARTYTMAALKEAMRLHPPAPLLYRKAVHSFALAGFEVTAGQQVWVSPYLLHRDPRHFTAPLQFRPDRFAAGRRIEAPRAAYIPFGLGPRTCIAMHQSFNQMALIALLVARYFQLGPVRDESGRTELIARCMPKDTESLPKR